MTISAEIIHHWNLPSLQLLCLLILMMLWRGFRPHFGPLGAGSPKPPHPRSIFFYSMKKDVRIEFQTRATEMCGIREDGIADAELQALPPLINGGFLLVSALLPTAS